MIQKDAKGAFKSKNLAILQHFIFIFSISYHNFRLIFLPILTMDITFGGCVDRGWGRGCCGCGCCKSSERYYFWIFTCNIIKCCPHNHRESIAKIICAVESVISQNGCYITKCQIILIVKLNVVFHWASCIKALPSYSSTTLFITISEKVFNNYWTRFD